MKKLFLLLLASCFILTACAVSPADKNNETLNTNEAATSNQSEATPPSNSKDVYIEDDFFTVIFSTYEEYILFLETGKAPQKYERHAAYLSELPDDFVSYDRIKKLGSFYSYMIFSPSYQVSVYYVTDANAGILELNLSEPFDENDGFPFDELTDLTINGDMRSLESPQTGFYYLENLMYRYVDGRLVCIYWVHNDVRYGLCYFPAESTAPMDFTSYPIDGEDTIASRLLNSETAAAALEELYSTAEGEE